MPTLSRRGPFKLIHGGIKKNTSSRFWSLRPADYFPAVLALSTSSTTLDRSLELVHFVA